MPYLIGIDNGGTVVKAGLYDVQGTVRALARADIPAILGKEGFVERSMDVLWEINCKVIKEVINKAGVKASDIACVAVCGHGNGLYLVDKIGRPTANGIYSTDMRAKEYVRRFEQTGVCNRIFPKTMQTLYPGQLAPLLAWMVDNKPDILSKSMWAFCCTDFIRFCLTGEAFGEITSMSAASVMNQNTKEYDNEVLDAMGIGQCRRLLPPIRQSCEVCGTLSARAAKQTGLKEGTLVAGGLIDITACAIATGITDESRLCLIAGTWSINEFISRYPLVAKGLLLTSVYCVDGYYMITDGSMTSASNLEWFVNTFFDCENNNNVFVQADDLASTVEPHDSNVIFLPFLYGTNTNADAKSCFLGLSGYHGKAHMLRAVYEGIVFSHRMHIEKLLQLSDKPKCIRIAGGVTKAPMWVQMFADALQMPIEVSDNTELGTMGAAMCASVATGTHSTLLAASKEFSKISYTCEPNTKNQSVYDKKYKLYKKVISKLETLWMEWNK